MGGYGVLEDDGDGRQGPGADHDGVHELDRDVLRVLGRARRPAPERAAGGETAGQGERRHGEAGRRSAQRVAVMTLRHVAPLCARGRGPVGEYQRGTAPAPDGARAARRGRPPEPARVPASP
jgi:hypothetical protein